MLGILRNSFRFSSKPISSLQSALNGKNVADLATKYACQQCSVSNVNNLSTMTPSWLISPARCFGTLRTLVSSSTGLLNRNAHLPEATGFDNSTVTTGGPYYVQSRGMKFKGKVNRRCKDCYLRWVNGMLYNLCKTHPRHKHGLKPAYYSNQRVMTHASMSPKRPW